MMQRQKVQIINVSPELPLNIQKLVQSEWDKIDKVIRVPNAVYLNNGILLDGKIIGFIKTKIVGNQAIIKNFVIRDIYRSRGLGTSIMRLIEKKLVKRKVNEVFVRVPVNLSRALVFYKNLGYKKTTIVKGFLYKSDWIYFRKDL